MGHTKLNIFHTIPNRNAKKPVLFCFYFVGQNNTNLIVPHYNTNLSMHITTPISTHQHTNLVGPHNNTNILMCIDNTYLVPHKQY